MRANNGAVDEAFHKIIKMVLSRELRPGDRVYETNLVEDFKMSRTPIREALSRLASTGFLEKLPKKKGYIVPILAPDDMEEIYCTRILLEGKAARRAAKYVDAESEKKLVWINQQEEEKFLANEKEEYASLNEDFHMTIAEMSKNKYLLRYIQQLFWRSNLYVFFFMRFYNVQNIEQFMEAGNLRLSYKEHRKIIEAIIAGDGRRAEKAMQEHLVIAYNSMLSPQAQPNISFEEFDLD
jgi:DNA-binding GntR family transcriptional regulator